MEKFIRENSMKFFSDYHHGGLARGLFLTLHWRLGHELYFPDPDFATYCNTQFSGNPLVWLCATPSAFTAMDGVPPHCLNPDGTFPFIASKEQFLSQDWDAVFVTRVESEMIFKKLLALHPNGDKIKIIAHSGNESTVYDWGWAKNFLSSDYLSYLMSPYNINKIHYSQEMGTQFASGQEKFTPITSEGLKNIGTFINCLASFTGPWIWNRETGGWGGRCPHCDGQANVGSDGPHYPYPLWTGLKDALPGYTFKDYGINNTCGMLEERNMPQAYHDCALTWHFKTYDGYGFSLLQSIALGRLPIVPRRFHRYRTAGRYLVNNLTCFETEWDVGEIANVIKYFTESLDRANMYSEACFNAAKALFNWDLESHRVKEFLDKLQ